MKKFLFTLLALLTCICTANAFIDKYTINRENLPEEARQMLDEHFPKAKISMIKVDRHLLKKTDYDITLSDGNGLRFNLLGQYKGPLSDKEK